MRVDGHNTHQSQPNSPPMPPIRPVYPFQAICADYFSYSGHHYLVAVDRYSNWPIVEEFAEGSKGLIAALRRVFVFLYKDRIVVPPTTHGSSVLQALHSAHQGVSIMVSRAEGSFFWPGMTPAIEEIHARCTSCNRMAPSQSNAPHTPPIRQVYPFQAICADYFSYSSQHYLVAVDGYSNWPMAEEIAEGSKGLIAALRRVFVTFVISEELSSDGGPEFMAGATKTCLRNWGVHHRLSSEAHPHSNCRAELGVKTVKRMLVGSTGPGGSLNTDAFQRAMLAYRNTPDPVSKVSPAEIIFGRRIRDYRHLDSIYHMDLARDTGREGGCDTCPTHEGT